MKNFYKNFVRENDLCFDIGANKGERTDVFLKLGAKVVVVEPQSSCASALEKKYVGNRNVTVVKCALGRSEGEAELRLCNETNECATLSGEFIKTYSDISGFHWTKTEKVKVDTLENLCAQYGVPSFCKIDVEGFESEVFLGLKSKIRIVMFEFNRPLLNDTIQSLEVLKTIGKYNCNFIAYEHMKPVLSEWISIDEFVRKIGGIISTEIMTGEILLMLDKNDL